MSLAIVQAAATPSGGSSPTPMSVVFGTAPTSGNLLMAIVFSIFDTPVLGTGWTQSSTHNFTSSVFGGTEFIYFYFKYAGASESTTQSPNSANLRFGYCQAWEISGVSGTFSTDHVSDTAATTDVNAGGSSMTFGTATTGANNELGLFAGTGRPGGSTNPGYSISGGSATTDSHPTNGVDASSGMGFHQAFPTSGTTTPAYVMTQVGGGSYTGTYGFIILKGAAASIETGAVSLNLSGVNFQASTALEAIAAVNLMIKPVNFAGNSLVEANVGAVTLALQRIAFVVNAFNLSVIATLRQFATFN